MLGRRGRWRRRRRQSWDARMLVRARSPVVSLCWATLLSHLLVVFGSFQRS